MPIARIGLVIASVLPLAWTIFNHVTGDIPHYGSWGHRMLAGEVPYTADFPLQYPPYALAMFIPPAIPGTQGAYLLLFGLEMLVLDVLIKWILLAEGGRRIQGARAYLPFCLFAAAGIYQYFIYLKRFDLAPATLTFLAIVMLGSGRAFASGVLLAAGIGTKLYPVVVAPVLFAAAWRNRQARRWVEGLAAGLTPLLLLAVAMPWWRFLTQHELRGLQVESLYAGFLWLAHFGGLEAHWLAASASYELGGPNEAAALATARLLMVITGVVSLAVSVACVRRDGELRPGRLARRALLPLLAFVAFNYVLSPQFMIWLVCLAALAITDRWTWPLGAVFAAVVLSPLVFPSPTYRTGLDFWRTVALCLRNSALVAGWFGLLFEFVRDRKRRAL